MALLFNSKNTDNSHDANVNFMSELIDDAINEQLLITMMLSMIKAYLTMYHAAMHNSPNYALAYKRIFTE
jgi:hypothetical protein